MAKKAKATTKPDSKPGTGPIMHACFNCGHLYPDNTATYENCPKKRWPRNPWGHFTCRECGKRNLINYRDGRLETIKIPEV